VIDLLHLRVSTPEGPLLEADGVTWMRIQLADGGSIGIRPGHAPLLAETVAAPLRYGDGLGEHSLDLEGGILHIHPQGVDVYASTPATRRASRQAPRQDRNAAEDSALESGEMEGQLRFDRLARSLLQALQADLVGAAAPEEVEDHVR